MNQATSLCCHKLCNWYQKHITIICFCWYLHSTCNSALLLCFIDKTGIARPILKWGGGLTRSPKGEVGAGVGGWGWLTASRKNFAFSSE